MKNVTHENQELATQNEGKSKASKKAKPRGRPRKSEDEQRTYPILVYFDKDTYDGIEAICKAENKSKSTVVYELIINGGYKEPLDAEETKMLRGLYNLGNNLNQLSKQANTYGMYDALAKQNKELADQVAELVVKLNERI